MDSPRAWFSIGLSFEQFSVEVTSAVIFSSANRRTTTLTANDIVLAVSSAT
jgi:hypothetical protein